MKNVSIAVDSAVYEFYRKVGLSAGGLPPEKVMADALFKLAGELSLQALHQKPQKNDPPERVILFACSRQPMVTLVFLGSCFLASLGMDSCRMPFSNLAVTSSGSTPSPT